MEPLAGAMKGSSELISGEDFKSMLDYTNTKNKDWVLEASMKGDLGDHPEMNESQFLPKLCDCESGNCVWPDEDLREFISRETLPKS